MNAIRLRLLWRVRRIYCWYYHIGRVEPWSISYLVETSVGRKEEGTLLVENGTTRLLGLYGNSTDFTTCKVYLFAGLENDSVSTLYTSF